MPTVVWVRVMYGDFEWQAAVNPYDMLGVLSKDRYAS
jgi:hypothetical protein